MKKRKLITLATLSFATCLGLSVYYANAEKTSAEELTPQLEIVGHTLSLENDVHIKYAVKAKNLNEDDKVKLAIVKFEGNVGSIKFVEESISPIEDAGLLDDEGNPLYVFEYTGVSAREMVDVLWSVAYVERDGVNYCQSEEDQYSVLDYVYNKLGKTESEPTADEGLEPLLNAMLSYGAAAQIYWDYRTDYLATDEYVYVRIDNTRIITNRSIRSDYGLFKPGEMVEITPDYGYELSADCDSSFLQPTEGGYLWTIPEDEQTIYTDLFVKSEVTEDPDTPVEPDDPDTPSEPEEPEDPETPEIPDVPSEGLTYNLLEDGTYEVSCGDCVDTIILIPDYVNGVPVTRIAENAFNRYGGYYAGNMTNIFIPETVTSIGQWAFHGCTALASVTFLGDSQLLEIENQAFNSCLSLKKVTFPEMLTTIGDFAFLDSGLTWVNLPASVISLGQAPFAGINLINIKVDENNPEYKAFNGALYTQDESVLIQFCSGRNEKSFTIPDTVADIGTLAFAGSKLSEVYFGDDVETIGDGAFYGCENMVSVGGIAGLPESLVSIEEGAFEFCSNLKYIIIPDTLETVGNKVFKSCERLTVYVKGTNQVLEGWTDGWNVDCPVVPITASGFEYTNKPYQDGLCWAQTLEDEIIIIDYVTSVAEIIIPDKINGYPVVQLADKLFYQAMDVAKVTIGNNVASIGDYTFYRCDYLSKVVIGNSVMKIGAYAFANSGRNTANGLDITFGENVNSIGDYAFYECVVLNVIIPDSVQILGKESFYNYYLQSVSIGAGVKEIGKDSFAGNKVANITVSEDNEYYQSIDGNLYTKDGTVFIQYAIGKMEETFVIPATVTRIEEYAFANAHYLESVTLAEESVTSIGEYAFKNTRFVNCDYVTFLGTETNPCYALVYIETVAQNITIPAQTKIMADYVFSNPLRRLQSIEVELGNEYFEIIDKTLYSRGRETLIKYFGEGSCFEVPNSVTKIAPYAFAYNDTLEYVYMGGIMDCGYDVTDIGDYAFSDCRNLKEVYFPGALKTIGCCIFRGCFSIQKVEFFSNSDWWVYTGENPTDGVKISENELEDWALHYMMEYDIPYYWKRCEE